MYYHTLYSLLSFPAHSIAYPPSLVVLRLPFCSLKTLSGSVRLCCPSVFAPLSLRTHTLSSLVLAKHTTISLQSSGAAKHCSHSFQWFRVFVTPRTTAGSGHLPTVRPAILCETRTWAFFRPVGNFPSMEEFEIISRSAYPL